MSAASVAKQTPIEAQKALEHFSQAIDDLRAQLHLTHWMFGGLHHPSYYGVSTGEYVFDHFAARAACQLW